MPKRLQKYLAGAGIASRRKAEELILAGRVMVNGETITELGTKVYPGDVVFFDGQAVKSEALEYHLLNKPEGVLSTVSDPQGRQTVTQLVPSPARLFPIGRLDQDTTGLIILTNDGELAHRLMHPRFEVDKVYRAEVEGVPDEEDLDRLRQGIMLDDGFTSPAQVEFVKVTDSSAVLEMTIHEGRKRQVRRMFEATGHPVVKLHRKKYAMLNDAGLTAGESRPLAPKEVKQLQQLVKEKKR